MAAKGMRSPLAIAALLLATAPAQAADPVRPTVVELYQSQGCSSCPPANALVNALAGRADILALSFAVTYWDRLGWKDIFGKPEFTARQWDYARAGRRGNVATPQMIVNGNAVVTGSNRAALIAALRKADRGLTGPVISIGRGMASIGAGTASRPAMVWLVRYDPRTINVPIGRGENGGRTLPHRNIVRSLTQIGTWRGQPARFSLPASSDARLAAAILIQDGKGGRILAARRI